MTESLVERFGVGGREVVAFVGGGGKSTLTLRLGRELADAGHPVVLTTTTKMGSDQIPDWATVCADPADVPSHVVDHPVYLLGSVDAHKVVGVAPEIVDAVFASIDATILVEADGARRRPFKAPGPNEPVIPSSTTLVVVVVGLDALGGRIADVCHRPERVAALTGRSLEDAVRPEDVATVATHAAGGRKHVPAQARIVLALTKVTPDHAQDVERIRALVEPTAVAVLGHEPRRAAPTTTDL